VQAPGQVQRGSGEGSGEGREALVQSQVRFNRVPEKVPKKVPGSLGAKPSQVQWVPERFRRRPGRLWCREGSGEGRGGFGAR